MREDTDCYEMPGPSEGGGVAVNQVLEAERGCSVSLLRFGKALKNWTLTSLYCNR